MRNFMIAAFLMVVACGTANAQAWQKIDCGNSRITVPGQVECRHGSPTQHLHYKDINNAGNIPILCIFENGSILMQSPGTTGYVRYYMQQPGTDAHCAVVLGGPSGPLFMMQHTNDITRSASDWAGLSEDGNRFFATFTSQEQRHCKAFLTAGSPVIAPYKSGYLGRDYYQYLLRGYLC